MFMFRLHYCQGLIFQRDALQSLILQTNLYVNWLNNTCGLTNYVMEITRFFRNLKIPKEVRQISTLGLAENVRLSQLIISKGMRLNFVLTYIGSEHITKKFWIFQFVIFIETKLLIISIHCLYRNYIPFPLISEIETSVVFIMLLMCFLEFLP